jgi:hypothetical protein
MKNKKFHRTIEKPINQINQPEQAINKVQPTYLD